ncbi:hypothetical protein [Polluticoccus soli]|uniref:hypothetical protein n=1 Tax=Polluticoccus soli TaxID=3034150 RepID=UPI0023E30E31|nr:hypothetical protein [Flavipsychrobacter sp. JY13-12]
MKQVKLNEVKEYIESYKSRAVKRSNRVVFGKHLVSPRISSKIRRILRQIKSKGDVKARIPVNLDLDRLIEAYPPDIPRFNKDMVHVICKSVYSQMKTLGEDFCHPRKHEPFYVPLNAVMLKKQIGNHYMKVVAWMMQVGILQCDGSYQAGSVSKGFKFGPSYSYESRWVTITDTILLRKLRKIADMPIPRHYCKRVVNRLENALQDGGLQIDAPKAEAWVNARYNASMAKAMKGKGKLTPEEVEIIRQIQLEDIKTIASGNIKLIQDDFGHRLHTPLTRLPKELRPFITYKGEELAEVDISGSQLLMATRLLDKRNYPLRGNKAQPDLSEVFTGSYLEVTGDKRRDTTIMFLDSLQSRYSKGFQEMDFVKDAASGEVYSRIVEELEKISYFKPALTEKEKRAKVKKTLLKQLFASPYFHKHKWLYKGKAGEIWSLFTTIYPEFAELTDHIKSKNHKDMSMILQRMESVLIIGRVCKRIQDEHPEVFIATIHDCLVTTKANKDLVRKILEEELQTYVGVAGTFSEKEWSMPKPVESPGS